MDPRAVLALCHEHAEAEAVLDIDRVLATLVPHPRFEYLPVGKTLEGWTTIETFYREQYPRFVTAVVGYELLGEWANEGAAIQEYTIAVRHHGRSATSHVVSIMPVDDDTGLVTGERLYCDEGFVRALLGPFFEAPAAPEPMSGGVRPPP
jgi:hypothetical protein